MTSINNNAFRNCKSLTNIVISDSLTQIKGYAFYNCYKLTSLIIPENVTNIETRVFYIGTGINKATIIFKPTTPPTITSNTFDTTTLNKIYVPSASVEAYKTATNWVAFADYIEADPNE